MRRWRCAAEKEITESVRNLRVRSVAGSTAKMAITIAAKSANLKGKFVRALKEMATAIREAKEDMAAQAATGESKRLQELCEKQ